MTKEVKAAWIGGICVIIAAIIGVFTININIQNNKLKEDNQNIEDEVLLSPIDDNSSNAELVIVSSVVGLSQEKAVSILENAKLNFKVWVNEEDIGDAYYVVNQSIPANSMVEIGTTIELQLAAD